MARLIAILALLLAASSAEAQTVHFARIDVTEYGLYTSDAEKALAPCAEGTTNTIVTHVRHAATTRTVPMQHGVQFGFRYIILGAPMGTKVQLREVVVFPPGGARPPKATYPVARDEAVMTHHVGASGFLDYSLDDPWEMVPGPWKLQLWLGNRVLVSETFNIVAR